MKKLVFGLIATVMITGLSFGQTTLESKAAAGCRTFSVGVNIGIFSVATDVTICCTGGWCGCGTHPNCTMNRTSVGKCNSLTENEINVDVVMNDPKVVEYINSQNQINGTTNAKDDFVKNNKLNIINSKPIEVDGKLYSLQLGSYTIENRDGHYYIYAKIIKA